MKHIIHTSERKDFKTCRQKWDFRSPSRMNLEPLNEARALSLGTAVHAGQEVWYEPSTWTADRDAVAAMALLAFKNALPAEAYYDPEEWAIDLATGAGMLRHYFEWSEKQDKGFTPKYVELSFEVPIPDLVCGHFMSELSNDSPTGFIPHDCNVYYAGRVDALWEDEHGGFWIVDHKTAGKFDSEDFMLLDQQITSYCWALQHVLGIEIQGFIYNEMRKDVPHKPSVLKSGQLSKDKSQNTTYELYLTAVQEGGYPVALYADILEHFKNQGNKFFRRTIVRRSPRELQIAGEIIALEAADMLGNPSIYPNPDRHCSWCAFRAPCIARMEGSDYQWILDGNYKESMSRD